MRVAITGATGYVGAFIADAARRAGHDLVVLGRRKPVSPSAGTAFQPWTLGEAPDLSGIDALVHAAFAHVPGRFRGGEGSDPAGFLVANRDGSLRLIEIAKRAGISCVIQISSRAVLDGYPAGTLLTEDLPPRPTSLYGQVKAELEAALVTAISPDFAGISLRATGVYGAAEPGQAHKWSQLLNDLIDGKPIPSRVSTEIHGADLAQAVMLLLGNAASRNARPRGAVPRPGMMPPAICHASDIVLDHRDLALAVARLLGRDDIPAPPRSDARKVSVLDCTNLRRLGWEPRGFAALEHCLPSLVAGAQR